jgi:hypothetical protein
VNKNVFVNGKYTLIFLRDESFTVADCQLSELYDNACCISVQTEWRREELTPKICSGRFCYIASLVTEL